MYAEYFCMCLNFAQYCIQHKRVAFLDFTLQAIVCVYITNLMENVVKHRYAGKYLLHLN